MMISSCALQLYTIHLSPLECPSIKPISFEFMEYQYKVDKKETLNLIYCLTSIDTKTGTYLKILAT